MEDHSHPVSVGVPGSGICQIKLVLVGVPLRTSRSFVAPTFCIHIRAAAALIHHYPFNQGSHLRWLSALVSNTRGIMIEVMRPNPCLTS